jgi:hypothetical protein
MRLPYFTLGTGSECIPYDVVIVVRLLFLAANQESIVSRLFCIAVHTALGTWIGMHIRIISSRAGINGPIYYCSLDCSCLLPVPICSDAALKNYSSRAVG